MSKRKTAVGAPDPDYCRHLGHAGGHGPMPVGPGCWCGSHGYTVCPDVKPSKPTDTIVRFNGTLTEDHVADLRALAEVMYSEPKLKPSPVLMEADLGKIRRFESGASRDSDEGKLDFEAYLSPLVLLRYAEYMQKHEIRSDGTKRAPDDWQQGMPKAEYMKSLKRHVEDVHLSHRGHPEKAREDIETALCAVIFNAMGYLFNILEGKDS